ncbi:hypothetical protein FRC12_014451 [Ceratobasidium sp. 428]|nr:hypothetical protein FRC12_014451 [Ceratobasidium sp. 428]
MIIPDGFGRVESATSSTGTDILDRPASETMARDFIQWNNSVYGWNHQLASDTIHIGSVRTRSSSSYVTDSSAAATAYSCAIKTFNGAVAIDEKGNPCGTVLEAAKLSGFKTGLVVTSHVTDATPASFASHIWDRNQEDKIAVQLIGDRPMGRVVDLLFGGGLVYFQPNTTRGSARSDSRNLIGESQAAGVHTLASRANFDALEGGTKAALPILGLFSPRALAYEIDRDPGVEPSLLEMAQTALETLKRATASTDKGFFIKLLYVNYRAFGNW